MGGVCRRQDRLGFARVSVACVWTYQVVGMAYGELWVRAPACGSLQYVRCGCRCMPSHEPLAARCQSEAAPNGGKRDQRSSELLNMRIECCSEVYL